MNNPSKEGHYLCIVKSRILGIDKRLFIGYWNGHKWYTNNEIVAWMSEEEALKLIEEKFHGCA